MTETAVRLAPLAGAGDAASRPIEWAVECVRVLMRAAARSERAFVLWREILDRAARGDLPPAALQDALAELGRTHEAEPTRQWRVLHARFLMELAQAATGGATGPAPLEADPEDPAAWCHRIAAEATTTRLADTLSVHAAPPPLSDHLDRVARVAFDLLNELTEMRARVQEAALRGVLAAGDGWGLVTPSTVELAGTAGDVASASIVLENTGQRRVVVRCGAPPVRRADGVGPAFEPSLTIEPDALALEPGAEGALRLSLRLEPASYEPDAAYIGTLHVTREPGSRLDVPLRIVAISPAARTPPHADPR